MEESVATVLEQAARVAPNPLDLRPALRQWRTSTGFCVLGLLVDVGINGVIGVIEQVEESVIGVAPLVGYGLFMLMCLVFQLYLAFCIIYAAVIFPSYFTERPLIRSREVINLLNFACGGILFGALWNTRMTQSRARGVWDKGKSSTVFIVLMALLWAYVIYWIFAVIGVLPFYLV